MHSVPDERHCHEVLEDVRDARDLPAEYGKRLRLEALDLLEAELGPRGIEYESKIVVRADAQPQHASIEGGDKYAVHRGGEGNQRGVLQHEHP
jgi:hypothetical protein